jgi:hypothetical protein
MLIDEAGLIDAGAARSRAAIDLNWIFFLNISRRLR